MSEDIDEFDCAYVKGLEDLLRAIMDSGSAIADGSLTHEGFVKLYRRAQVHLGDLTQEQADAQDD